MFVSVCVRARVYTDDTGAYTEIPVMRTHSGILEPLLDYCLAYSNDRSLAWMKKLIRAVDLFLKYLVCNPSERDSYRLFQNFAQRLYTGTFDRATGLDPSGLCWFPRGAQDARIIITQLTDFFDWLSAVRPAAADVNPRYAGGSYDRMTDEAAYQYRRDKAFLGHTWAANATAAGISGHRVRPARLPRVNREDPPAFPDDRFEEFLGKGFLIGGNYDYRNMLITLLLHGAGFRASEPFHLYIQDVFPDPANKRRAMVRIYHPHSGDAPADWLNERGRRKNGNRAAYLAEKFGLAPRTELLGARGAGWKGGMHNPGYCKQAYWFVPDFGELFLKLWQLYLEQVARMERNHPFAFINLGREPRGAMYCLGQYNKAHAAAVKRIKLPVSKLLGTTPHGHRHAYCRRLTKAHIDKALCRRFMHHASIDSQDVYSGATSAEALAALEAAAARLQALPSRGPNAFVLDKRT